MIRRVWPATTKGIAVEGRNFRVHLDLPVYTYPNGTECALYGFSPDEARELGNKLIAAADAAMLSGSGMVRDE